MTDHTKPTCYHLMQREAEQQLELDAATDGHDALRLQAERLRNVPRYPSQPATSPWASDPVGTEPPTGEAIDAVKDVSKVGN
jgi:hypothetical protein